MLKVAVSFAAVGMFALPVVMTGSYLFRVLAGLMDGVAMAMGGR